MCVHYIILFMYSCVIKGVETIVVIIHEVDLFNQWVCVNKGTIPLTLCLYTLPSDL